MVLLYSLAFVFEFVGLVLAFLGFDRTWREYEQHEGLWVAFRRKTGSGLRRTAAAGRQRLLSVLPRKRRETAAHAGVATGSASATLSGITMAATGFSLPSFRDDPEKFANAVRDQLAKIDATAQKAVDAIAKERDQRTQALSDLRGQVEVSIADVAGKSRSVAVGGLVEQIWGWIFILLGVVIGTLGNILQAIAD